MAMKKAEMEAHRDRYSGILAEARAAVSNGLYNEAVKLALSSWDYVDGMMQYVRRYEEREFDSIEAIEIVLKYAPVLLHYESLDVLESLLQRSRRIEKNTTTHLGDQLVAARQTLERAHRLWDRLETDGAIRQDHLARTFGGEQAEWRGIAELWETVGIVDRLPEGCSYILKLGTRLGALATGKCPACGVTEEAPKAIFLEKTTCPKCSSAVAFVLLPTHS